MPNGNSIEQAPASPRSEEIQRQIQALSGRDLQLWSISILIILVLAAGFLAMVVPNITWRPGLARIEDRYLPQFFFGLITLVVLFNIYVAAQKRSLNTTRLELIRELVIHERLESVSLVDPLTQLFNSRSFDLVVSREIMRSNRLGTGLTFVAVSLDSLKFISARLGNHAADQFIAEFARLVKDNFRGSDIVLRYRDATLLVVMPDTTEQQAECAVRRLLATVDQWNVATKSGWEIALSYGVAPYVSGTEVKDIIRAVERKLCLKQQKLVPVFVPYTNGNAKSQLPV